MKWHLVTQRAQWDMLTRVARTKSNQIRRTRLANFIHKDLIAKGFDLEREWRCFEATNGDLLYIQEDVPGELRE